MALEDPFSAVRGEVQKAVNTARGLYERWCELLQETHVVSTEEFDWTTNELRNSLRSIEWDLEDLEETIGIVESNPRKFRIEASELTERRAFVRQMRDSVKEMRDHISSPSALAFAERKNREMLIGGGASQKPPPERYGQLREELVSANSRYIEEQQLHQQDAGGVCPGDGSHPVPHGRRVEEDGQGLPHDQRNENRGGWEQKGNQSNQPKSCGKTQVPLPNSNV
ncbi:syntaxin-10 isoform X4 [Gopherus evgoodei]|uniref:syntaxin-10 isoform X4 n=1 Tax=Gopherus evgoodei TaxID=1825980 RepID=UPI0011CF6D11|nr:syntaxin-10 isoform X4 [Gopherus evgoodei]